MLPTNFAFEDLGCAIQHGENLVALDKLADFMVKTTQAVAAMRDTHCLEVKTLANQIAVLEARHMRELGERHSREVVLQTKSAADSQTIAKQQELLSVGSQEFVEAREMVLTLKSDNMRLSAEKADALEQVAELKSQKLAGVDAMQQKDDEIRSLKTVIDRLTAVNEVSSQAITALQLQMVTLEQQMQHKELEVALIKKGDGNKQATIGILEGKIANLQLQIDTAQEEQKRFTRQQHQMWEQFHRQESLLDEKDHMLATQAGMIYSRDQTIGALEAKLKAANHATALMAEPYKVEFNAHKKTLSALEIANTAIKSHIENFKIKHKQLEDLQTLITNVQAIYNPKPHIGRLAPMKDHLAAIASSCVVLIKTLTTDCTSAAQQQSISSQKQAANQAHEHVVSLYHAEYEAHKASQAVLANAHKIVDAQADQLKTAQVQLQALRNAIAAAQNRFSAAARFASWAATFIAQVNPIGTTCNAIKL
jgi:chromosome segregation ATPase